jgi:hypothetical protein
VEFLSDRDAECWQPLFSVLAIADSARLPELRTYAEALTGSKSATAEDDSLPLKLLADIKTVFEANGADRLSSVDLCEELRKDETAPWIEFDHGKPITQRGLARMLARFCIAPRVIRLADGSTPRGYLKSSFNDAWGATSRFAMPERRPTSHSLLGRHLIRNYSNKPVFMGTGAYFAMRNMTCLLRNYKLKNRLSTRRLLPMLRIEPRSSRTDAGSTRKL